MLFNSKDMESEAEGIFSPRRKLRRTIYVLPTLFTVGNIFFGFYALVASLNGDFDTAAKAIGVAVVLDGLDGRVARMANATSDFGLQLDSLADVVSFGVAPAVLVYTWGMHDLGRMAQFSAFIFLICGAMRLARFNVQTSDLKSFAGLPIPAGAGFVAATVHFFKLPPDWPRFDLLLVVAIYLIAFLMISTIRYPSMKKLNLGRGKSHLMVVLMALVVAGMIWYSREALLLVAYTYVASGPALRLISALRRK